MEIDVIPVHLIDERHLFPRPFGRVVVVMINSRQESYPEMVERARNSVLAQECPGVPVDLFEVRNHARRFTIGACWNEAVKMAPENSLITFIGDDDYISPEFLCTMCAFYLAVGKTLPVDAYGVTSFMKLEKHGMSRDDVLMPASYTGMFPRSLLIDVPFDETLPNQVDTEFSKRITAKGITVATNSHYFGYYYRVHNDMVSGAVRFEKNPHLATGQANSKA